MRIRQALALVFLVALCGAAAANSATTRVSSASVVCQLNQASTKAKPCTATPLCKAGQTNTTKSPCVPAAQVQKPVAPIAIDPGDTGDRQGLGDAVTVFRYLNIPEGLYQLDVTNTSGLGYINTFTWVSPTNLNITRITASEGGKCSLTADGDITCVAGGKGVAPPACTCEGGGHLTVNFTATGLSPTYADGYYTYYGVVGSYLHILTMTPVPYHIGSFVQTNLDEPVCGSAEHKSKTSTKTSPCLTQ